MSAKSNIVEKTGNALLTTSGFDAPRGLMVKTQSAPPERAPYETGESKESLTNTPKLAAKWAAGTPYLQSVLRVVAAFMFMQAGTMKLFALPAGIPPDGGTVPLLSQMGLGGVLEVGGGLLMLVGLFTRPVAFVLSGMMAVAYFQFHFPGGFWPVMNGGVPAALYCFVWLYFSAAGAGPLSLDAKRAK